MTWQFDDTIAALASAPGGARRGIIRVSGDDCAQLVFPHLNCDTDCRTVSRATRIRGDFLLSDPFDEGLSLPVPADFLVWPNHRSYTGQPMIEIHTVGSPPLLDAILARLLESGIRPARAGEFTLRAFVAGRIDLVQAEAVLGVIDAADHEELDAALQQLAGGISGEIQQVRASLVSVLGDLEAGLDFVEEDIEFIDPSQLIARLDSATRIVDSLARQAVDRMQTQTCPKVVLAGPPNAGKSTLFNALAEQDAAIVSNERGTTRDYLSAGIDCDGFAVELIDTAGVDEAGNQIDAHAQELSHGQMGSADLVIWCSAVGEPEVDASEVNASDARGAVPLPESTIRVRTKADLPYASAVAGSPQAGTAVVEVSAHSGTGLSELMKLIRKRFERNDGGRRFVGTTGARCRESLVRALESLSRAREAAVAQLGDEIIAIEIRETLSDLGRVVGETHTDDILDHIFSNFCIGK